MRYIINFTVFPQGDLLHVISEGDIWLRQMHNQLFSSSGAVCKYDFKASAADCRLSTWHGAHEYNKWEGTTQYLVVLGKVTENLNRKSIRFQQHICLVVPERTLGVDTPPCIVPRSAPPYPQDFTFVCPTEIIAFSDRAKVSRR